MMGKRRTFSTLLEAVGLANRKLVSLRGFQNHFVNNQSANNTQNRFQGNS